MHHGPTFDRPTRRLRARSPQRPRANWRRGSRRLTDLTKKPLHRLRVAMHNLRRNRRRSATLSQARRLPRAAALVSCPVLNQIKLRVPVPVWEPANSFKFHTCVHTLHETRRLCFRLDPARRPRRRPPHIVSQQSLWLGLQRSLIVIDTPTLVLGRRASPRWALSPLVVLAGSANSTSRRPILPTSNFSLPPLGDGESRAHPPPRYAPWRNLGHSD